MIYDFVVYHQLGSNMHVNNSLHNLSQHTNIILNKGLWTDAHYGNSNTNFEVHGSNRP